MGKVTTVFGADAPKVFTQQMKSNITTELSANYPTMMIQKHNSVYVLFAQKQVVKYSSSGEVLKSFDFIDTPSSMFITDEKTIIVGTSNGKVFSFSEEGIVLNSFRIDTNSIGTVFSDVDGNIYVGGGLWNAIYFRKYTPQGTLLWSNPFSFGNNNFIEGICKGAENEIIVLTNNMVRRINATTGSLILSIATVAYARQVHYDGANIFAFEGGFIRKLGLDLSEIWRIPVYGHTFYDMLDFFITATTPNKLSIISKSNGDVINEYNILIRMSRGFAVFFSNIKHLIKSSNKIYLLNEEGQWVESDLQEPLSKEDFETYGLDNLSDIADKLDSLPDEEFEIITWTDSQPIEPLWLELTTQPFKPIDILNKAESFEVLTWTDESSSIELQANGSLQTIDSGKLFSFELNDFSTIANIEIK